MSTLEHHPSRSWKDLCCHTPRRSPSPPGRNPSERAGLAGTPAAMIRSLSELNRRRPPATATVPSQGVGTVHPESQSGGVAPVRPPPSKPKGPSVDPEVLRKRGDKESMKGRFEEAIGLYDRAIAADGRRAECWSGKAAALVGLGRLLDAVEACHEALKIEGSSFPANRKMADLYLRLGDTTKAMHHYQQSGDESNSSDFNRVHSVRSHTDAASEARKRKDWQRVLDETHSALSEGASSAPQVFASQAEALLKLQRHEEADRVLRDAPVFDMDAATKYFGAPTYAFGLSVQAQVHLAMGRFEEAVAFAERALKADPTNKEVMAVVRRMQSVSRARSTGNELFNQGKYREACSVYQEGLEHEPNNSVLLCNLAAVQVRLGLWEDAVAGCDEALKARPSYHKARLRRADCNFKLKRWEAAIRDYEVLMKENPNDEVVSRTLWEARFRLMKEKKKPDDV